MIEQDVAKEIKRSIYRQQWKLTEAVCELYYIKACVANLGQILKLGISVPRNVLELSRGMR